VVVSEGGREWWWLAGFGVTGAVGRSLVAYVDTLAGDRINWGGYFVAVPAGASTMRAACVRVPCT